MANYKFETIVSVCVETLPPTTLELGKDKQQQEFALSTSRRSEIRQRNQFFSETEEMFATLRWFVGLGIWLWFGLRSRAWDALAGWAGLLLVVIYIRKIQGIYNATRCNQRARRNLCVKIVYAMDSWDATTTTTTTTTATKSKILFMSFGSSSARTVKSKSSSALECVEEDDDDQSEQSSTKRLVCREPKSSGETNWIAPRYKIFMYSMRMFLCFIRNDIERQA